MNTGGIDIAKLSVWDNIRWRILKGEAPRPDELLAAIAAEGVPRDLGPEVARMLTRPPGRPRETREQKYDRWARVLGLTAQVAWEHAANKRAGISEPHERALHSVAGENCMGVEYLRDLVKKGLRGAPRSVREQALNWREALDALDPETEGEKPAE